MRTQRRDFEMTVTRAAKDDRVLELSFSSELPVNRGSYWEVLSHDRSAMDMSRIGDGNHPLLLGHDPDKQIGVVQSAWIGADKKGRAKVKFSASQLGQEILQDVKEGIRALVSCGYQITKELSRELLDDGRELIRFAWTPTEISIVPIPADSSVGVGRSQTQILGHRLEATTNNLMTAEQNRIEIEAIRRNLEGRVDGINELASRAILSGTSVEEFRRTALDRLPEVKPIAAPSPTDFSSQEWRDLSRFSISKAIMDVANRGGLTGVEREVSDEFTKRTGAKPTGFFVPDIALAARNFVQGVGTLGGMIVSTPNLGAEFISILRNRAQVINAGAKILSLGTPVTIPRQSGAGSVNWVGETVAATLSTGNFTQITLTPFCVSAFQQYSRQLLSTSNPDIDSLVRGDIAEIIGLEIDRVALFGSGSGQPTGIANTTGVGTVGLATNGLRLDNATAYPALVSLESQISTSNADSASCAYLVRPNHRGQLRVAQRFASTDSPVFETEIVNGEPRGRINGYNAFVTAQLSNAMTHGTATTVASAIIMGDFGQLLIADFNSGSDVIVDPYVLAANGVVRVICRRLVDIGVRHPESFSMLLRILGG